MFCPFPEYLDGAEFKTKGHTLWGKLQGGIAFKTWHGCCSGSLLAIQGNRVGGGTERFERTLPFCYKRNMSELKIRTRLSLTIRDQHYCTGTLPLPTWHQDNRKATYHSQSLNATGCKAEETI